MHVDYFVKECLRQSKRYGKEPIEISEGKELLEVFQAEKLCGIMYNLLDKTTAEYLLNMANEVTDEWAEDLEPKRGGDLF